MSELSLSKEQYKMLCKIKKHKGLSRSSLSDVELAICQYLLMRDCIAKPKHVSIPWQIDKSQTQNQLPEHLVITQFGEAQVYTFRSKFYKWWIPVVISIIALITSIAVPVFQLLLQRPM